MKIAVVSQYYSPEPVPVPASVAQELARRGHDVRVLTGIPNYPGGKLYQGYSNAPSDEDVEGIPVRRVALFLSRPGDALGRIRNYVSFARRSRAELEWIRGVDAVYVYATQMTAAVGPARWARRSVAPYVLHVQDLWPESITESGLTNPAVSRLISLMLRRWLARLYRGASAIIAIGPSMAELLAQRGAQAETLAVAMNWAPDEPSAAPVYTAGDPTQTRVVFAGNLGMMQDLETVVAAAALVADVEGLTIELVGSGAMSEALPGLIMAAGARNIMLSPRVGREDMPRVYARSDFQLVTLKDSPVFAATIPSKLASAFAHGVPVITAIGGDVTDIVTASKAGLAAQPSNAASLAAALRAAAATTAAERRQMAENAHNFYSRTMSMRAGIDQVEDALLRARDNRKQEGNT